LGIEGIVPAIVITAILSFGFTFYFIQRAHLQKEKVSFTKAFREGRGMIILGLTLSVSSIVSLLVAYILQIYISSVGGVAQVGLYSAAIVILNTYVGIVFTAMATDYFPRLSEIADRIEKVRSMVFEQAFIAILILTPIIVAFLALAPVIIHLLYSSKFDAVVPLVRWGILGMLFKAVSWSMGYVIIAKGDAKVFINTAIGFSSILLLSNVLGYYYGGLEGLGMSFLAYYMFHFIVIHLILKFRYDFYFYKGFYPILLLCLASCIAAFLLTFLPNGWEKYVALLILMVFATWFSFYQLDKKMDIRELFSKIFRRGK
ncbi:MAG: oligosaccharide flippase family protein, partial [Flavobacteriaceae bacterium]|nr:oligosaccharide flippase family protein [Flavobacteriaceae bacterium]